MSIGVDVRIAVLSAIIEGFQRSETQTAEPVELSDVVPPAAVGSQQVRRSKVSEATGKTPRSAGPLEQPNFTVEVGDYARQRKEFIGWNAQLRFAALKDWVSINMLAIFRRASHEWKSVNDLIDLVPAYFEPEAEVLDGRVLLISTQGHDEQLAIPVDELDPSSEAGSYFEVVSGRKIVNRPAVLLRSNGHLQLVSKGTVMQPAFPRLGPRRTNGKDDDSRFVIITRRNSSAALGKYVWEFLEQPRS